jgi:hypothetical protein
MSSTSDDVDRQIARLAWLTVLRKAVALVGEHAPEHHAEARALAERHIEVAQHDGRRGPDQGRRVQDVLALAARGAG